MGFQPAPGQKVRFIGNELVKKEHPAAQRPDIGAIGFYVGPNERMEQLRKTLFRAHGLIDGMPRDVLDDALGRLGYTHDDIRFPPTLREPAGMFHFGDKTYTLFFIEVAPVDDHEAGDWAELEEICGFPIRTEIEA